MKLQLHTLLDTATLAAVLADALVKLGPFAILFYGPLGSGKTTFARELVTRLPGGDAAEVSSPSFTLANAYPTEPAVLHCDLYRNGESPLPDDVAEAFEEPGTAVLVEWSEYLPPADMPRDFLAITFDIACESCEDTRALTLEASGPRPSDALSLVRERCPGLVAEDA